MNPVARTFIAISTLVMASAGPGMALGAEVSFDGLERIEDADVAMAYIDPEADFSVFKRVVILEPPVAFRSNWERDQNRSRRRNIRAADMERIQRDIAALFTTVFTERLEAGGFEVVDVAGDDVLALRPAIIDLDISAVDAGTAGRSRTYTASAGAATLYIQLFDSVTGDILGRAADRRVARRAGGMMTWNNRVTNTAEARRLFIRWGDQLVNFLNQHYLK